jgi:adenosylcobinamide kinase/adenosylcobinamide-phosphate guanylyltransferase
MAGPRPGLTLILGGARSGKSDHAEELATKLAGPVLYVATAEGLDPEMRSRIAAHQARRPPGWHTLEVPRGVGRALDCSALAARAGVILLDCLTLLVSNTILATGGPDGSEPDHGAAWEAVRAEVDSLLAAHQRLGAHMIIVSNEVGLGIVPAYSLGRIYRDCLGWANQAVARSAGSVILMVAGLPLDVRALTLKPYGDTPGSDATGP